MSPAHEAVVVQKPYMLQGRPQTRLVEGQRLADTVPHRAGLTRQATTLNRAPHIELAEPVGHDKGLTDQHAQHGAREIDRAVAAIDLDPAIARLDPDAGGGVLALAGRGGAADSVAHWHLVLGEGSK